MASPSQHQLIYPDEMVVDETVEGVTVEDEVAKDEMVEGQMEEDQMMIDLTEAIPAITITDSDGDTVIKTGSFEELSPSNDKVAVYQPPASTAASERTKKFVKESQTRLGGSRSRRSAKARAMEAQYRAKAFRNIGAFDRMFQTSSNKDKGNDSSMSSAVQGSVSMRPSQPRQS